MNTRREEKQHFSRVASIIRVSEAEVVEPGYLSTEVIQQVSQEVERLNKLKTSRMKMNNLLV
ncbi:putative microtubule-associated protein, MAP65/Ase1/PRC1 [Helianthus annuus]|nr:putative microtubule-associated protein, MAP65/Ase1/PRC1 [Helianthus annuus]